MKYLILLFAALTFSSCQQKTEESKPAAAQPSARQYNKNVSLLLSVEGSSKEQSPNFTWYDENGKQISFAEFSKGKPVLINFWATWCGPCIKETPDLVELHKEFSEKGGLVIGISEDRGDDAMELVNEFTKEHNVTYPIIVDSNGDLEEAFGGLRGYPTTFYVDKDGKVAKKLLGLQSKDKFTQTFNALL